MRNTLGITAALLATTLAVTACSGTPDDTDRDSIDARAYFENYDSEAYEGQALAQPNAAAGAAEGSTGDRVTRCDDCRPPTPPPIDVANTFTNPGTNPVIDPDEQPTSTFGLDVDTGSYRVAQRLLDNGLIPPRASVRPEEWINAFDYGDPAPEEAALGVTAETAASAVTRTQMLRVAVNARELRDGERPPAALTFVVDTSGSMDIRDRLGLVKSSLALLAKNLRPDDTIAIVTYDNTARSVLEPTPVSETDTILDAIDDLEPGGGTNLEAGVELGYEYAARSADGAGINAVILASDGVANIGLTDPDGLADKVNAAATDDDIHLVTVGYGMGNYNDHLMEQLADQGQGFYSYVSTFTDARQLYARDLTSTLSVVAQDAKAQVEFDPQMVESYRLIGYENRALSAKDFDDASVDAGEVGSGMDVTALYEVTPSDEAHSGVQIGTATVRWESAADDSQAETSTPLRMPGISAAPSDAMLLATTVAEFAETVKHRQHSKGFGEHLHTLRDTADSLAADDVAGAPELSDMIGRAIGAQPTGRPYEMR